MTAEILEALAESASAGIGISAAVMAIAKELEPLMKTASSSSSAGSFRPRVVHHHIEPNVLLAAMHTLHS
jgi:predicted urease superfamily metal-dependent hydrolase